MTILQNMGDPEYFALPSLDQSQLKQFLNNPADWAYKRINGVVKETQALNFGTAFHAYLMNTGTVVSLPEGETFAKKANKEWRAQHEAAGDTVVTFAEMQMLDHMKQNIIDSSKASDTDYMDIIEHAYCEHVIEWVDEKSGLTLKAKPDVLPVGLDYLVDLKTTRSIDEDEFAKEAWNYGYHIQAEFYRAAVAQLDPESIGRKNRLATGMQFWAFQKTDDCDWRPISISADSDIAALARTSIRNGLNRMAEIVEKANDAGFGEGLDAAAKYILHENQKKEVKELEFPDWALRSAENLL